jgi:hypothetical protein
VYAAGTVGFVIQGSPYTTTFFLDWAATSLCAETMAKTILEPHVLLLETGEAAQILLDRVVYGAYVPRWHGGDGRSPFSRAFRKEVAPRLRDALSAELTKPRISPVNRQAITSLLTCVKTMSLGGDPSVLRDHRKLGQANYNRCSREGCPERGIAVCGRCQCFRYCSRKCQRLDWKDFHRIRCFRTNFRQINLPDAKSAST